MTGTTLEGIREIGKGACQLTWQYFHPKTSLPNFINFLSRYDVWDLDPMVVDFQKGMYLYNTDVEDYKNSLWPSLFKGYGEFIPICIEKGKTVLEYDDIRNAIECKNNAFEIDFEGLKCIAINGGLGSGIFKSVWSHKYDMMISFSTNGKIWRISFYSDRPNVDCSLIAKKYGGGGHFGAAGCTLKELPFEIH
jgi:hypothetical protein